MTTERTEAVPNLFKRILTALNTATTVRHECKLVIGVSLAMAAFAPAFGIAAMSLSAIADEQNRLALLYRREIILSQQLKNAMEAEDTLMPLFVLSGERRMLDQFRQKEDDFDIIILQLKDVLTPGSRAAQLLNDIALLAHRRDALAGQGITMRLEHDQSILNVNHYFEQNTLGTSEDLHHGMDAFMQLTNARFEDFVVRQRRTLHHIGIMLLTAGGFALAVCIGVGTVLIRLLQTKRQHDMFLARQAEWERALSTARKEAVETVAHDLRNPLQVMLFAAEKLQRVTTDRQSAQAALDNFTGSAISMRRLIDTVLNPANIGAETLPMFKKPLDLHLMLHDVASRFHVTAAAKNINLTYAPSRDLPELFADEARLEQVISNLLANAIKFTPTYGSVTLATAWAEPWITITVTDTGRGMSQEQVDNVFNRYWRGGTTPEHGSGLGLAISKAIIDAHDGRIEVNSTPSHGSAFAVFMPATSTMRRDDANQHAHVDRIA